MDNTFANPDYDFPAREDAYKSLKEIVNSHPNYRVYVFAYNLGKEEVLINMAEDFKTYIVVDEDRMRKIKLMDLRPELFTTNPSEGWVHFKYIKDLKNLDIEESNREEPTVYIVLSGWSDKYTKNLPFYFNVQYSSHSNFRELETLVKACCPKNIVFNVDDRAVTKRRLEFQQYLMKEYVGGVKSAKNTDSKYILNDPMRGAVQKIITSDRQSSSHQKNSDKGKKDGQNDIDEVGGFAKNGDVLLQERFNPNNKELNK